MKRIKENKELLKIISKCSKAKDRKVLLQKGSDEFIKSILEIVLNIVKGNVKIPDSAKRKLKKYKKVLRQLICPNTSLKFKRRTLIQKGGFLTTLLPTIIGGVLSYIFSKKNE